MMVFYLFVGMDANRRIQSGMPARKLNGSAAACEAGPGVEQASDARSAGTLNDCRAVSIECLKIQVAMRVAKHGRRQAKPAICSPACSMGCTLGAVVVSQYTRMIGSVPEKRISSQLPSCRQYLYPSVLSMRVTGRPAM